VSIVKNITNLGQKTGEFEPGLAAMYDMQRGKDWVYSTAIRLPEPR